MALEVGMRTHRLLEAGPRYGPAPSERRICRTVAAYSTRPFIYITNSTRHQLYAPWDVDATTRRLEDGMGPSDCCKRPVEVHRSRGPIGCLRAGQGPGLGLAVLGSPRSKLRYRAVTALYPFVRKMAPGPRKAILAQNGRGPRRLASLAQRGRLALPLVLGSVCPGRYLVTGKSPWPTPVGHWRSRRRDRLLTWV